MTRRRSAAVAGCAVDELAALSARGFEMDASLDREEWEAVGRNLGRLANASLWWVGDWLLFGESKWGSMYDEAQRITGLSYDTLKKAKSVSTEFKLGRRRPNLSWSHHREVAALPPGEQDEWLAVAEEEQLSRKDLRERVREERVEGETGGAGSRHFDLDEATRILQKGLRTTFLEWPEESRCVFLSELQTFIAAWEPKL